jgi:hypothetical protein
MKHVAKDKQTVQRRMNTVARLEAQLKLGSKLLKNEHGGGLIPLSAEDRKRIETELLTLKSRI